MPSWLRQRTIEESPFQPGHRFLNLTDNSETREKSRDDNNDTSPRRAGGTAARVVMAGILTVRSDLDRLVMILQACSSFSFYV